VQGDGGAALPAALAAYWRRVPVVHLDAGRRSAVLGSVDPAEANRRLLTQVVTVHLAAAQLAAMNLLDEKVAGGDVLLTGNTAVDAAALGPRRGRYADPTLTALRDSGSAESGTNRLLLVGVQRTSGVALDFILAAVRRLSARHTDLDVVVLGADPAGRACSPRRT
jgi:UDP-N-acetylglucosamine 2-epimerase (non-hydrolysing)